MAQPIRIATRNVTISGAIRGEMGVIGRINGYLSRMGITRLGGFTGRLGLFCGINLKVFLKLTPMRSKPIFVGILHR